MKLGHLFIRCLNQKTLSNVYSKTKVMKSDRVTWVPQLTTVMTYNRNSRLHYSHKLRSRMCS